MLYVANPAATARIRQYGAPLPKLVVASLEGIAPSTDGEIVRFRVTSEDGQQLYIHFPRILLKGALDILISAVETGADDEDAHISVAGFHVSDEPDEGSVLLEIENTVGSVTGYVFSPEQASQLVELLARRRARRSR